MILIFKICSEVWYSIDSCSLQLSPFLFYTYWAGCFFRWHHSQHNKFTNPVPPEPNLGSWEKNYPISPVLGLSFKCSNLYCAFPFSHTAFARQPTCLFTANGGLRPLLVYSLCSLPSLVAGLLYHSFLSVSLKNIFCRLCVTAELVFRQSPQ